MWKLVKEHPTAVIVAVLAHLALVAFFVVNIDRKQQLVGEGGVEPIKAEAIIDPSLMPAAEPKAPEPPPEPEPDPEEEQRKLEEERRQAELEEQKRQQEEAARQAELKKQKEEAEKQALAEKKAAEEQKRKAEALKKKKEEEARQAEIKRKKEAEAKRQAELKKKQEAEAKRKAELKKKQEAEKRRKAEAERKRKEEARRRAAQRKAEAEAEARRLAEAQAREEQMLADRRLQGERNDYILAIKQRVQSKWLRPPGSSGNFSCKVRVTQAPGGLVLNVVVKPSASCDADMQQSVERAVMKADPLPKAPSKRVYERIINFTFEP